MTAFAPKIESASPEDRPALIDALMTVIPNPFAMVVLAHLKTLETRRSPADRQAWKLKLVRGCTSAG